MKPYEFEWVVKEEEQRAFGKFTALEAMTPEQEISYVMFEKREFERKRGITFVIWYLDPLAGGKRGVGPFTEVQHIDHHGNPTRIERAQEMMVSIPAWHGQWA